tara:strand:- start:1678 stop:2964 length:1287 start_codon:yes stop_codon:yes gene_type:complete
MGSTYTDNGGIEKIGLGEQAGAWGTTTNNNFDIIDRLINGVGSISLSGATSDLSTSDGSLSNGMFKVLVLAGSPDLGHVITIDPPNADKLYFVKNGTGQAITFNQGTGGTVGNSRAVSIGAGKGAIIFADGAGTGAAVTDLTALFVNSQAIDDAVIGGTTPAAITGTTITATTSILPDTSGGADIGSTSAEFGDIYIADDKKIHFGNDQDATIEYDEDGTDKLVVTGNVTFADGSTDVDIASHDTSNGLKLGGTLVTATAAELNIMDGVTATKDELNIMDGVTATTAELNIMDGVTRTASQINSARDGTVTSVVAGTGLSGGTITSTGTISVNTGIGNVGTYAFLARQGYSTIVAGQTYTNSGSGANNNSANLVYAGFLGEGDNNFDDDTALDSTGSSTTTGLTGVWRAMGSADATSRVAATLFLRIS